MIKEISSSEAYGILQESVDAVLIDVRTKMEYEYVGHPKDSIHIALKEPPEWKTFSSFVHDVSSLLKEKFPDVGDLPSIKIFLICRSGKRSNEAALLLEADGYKCLFNVYDGFEGDKNINGHRNLINGWRFSNLPWEQN